MADKTVVMVGKIHGGENLDDPGKPPGVLIPADIVMVDGELYWLGATYGEYRKASDSFDMGNCFVARSITVYRNHTVI